MLFRSVQALPPQGVGSAGQPQRGRREGGEEWHDLRPHRPEDSPSRLAWALLAQGRGSYSKRFASPGEPPPLLAPDPSLPREQALEHLSERIWRLHGQGVPYGLSVGATAIPPDHGSAHRDRCLQALAQCP